jgi:hypothetical protein
LRDLLDTALLSQSETIDWDAVAARFPTRCAGAMLAFHLTATRGSSAAKSPRNLLRRGSRESFFGVRLSRSRILRCRHGSSHCCGRCCCCVAPCRTPRCAAVLRGTSSTLPGIGVSGGWSGRPVVRCGVLRSHGAAPGLRNSREPSLAIFSPAPAAAAGCRRGCRRGRRSAPTTPSRRSPRPRSGRWSAARPKPFSRARTSRR